MNLWGFISSLGAEHWLALAEFTLAAANFAFVTMLAFSRVAGQDKKRLVCYGVMISAVLFAASVYHDAIPHALMTLRLLLG